MNTITDLLRRHRCVRTYNNKAVSDEILDNLISAVQQSPSSINAQQTSLVVVRNTNTRKRISEIAGGQPWIAEAPVFIAVIMDFYKTSLAGQKKGQEQKIHESLEATVVGAVDAGIILGNLITAAESLGLGIVPIGGIRNDPAAMIELLQLPPLTFPVAGLCLGYERGESYIKPRLSMDSFHHDEVYKPNGLQKAIEEYDETLITHWKKVGRSNGEPWSETVAGFYQHIYFPRVKPVLAQQGFLNDK
ncbi:MAG TPA: NADPH-dependent oxidoreductase [Gammaproteobacteria bacterium]|nr:NADPH-dependent oxidoreductase [Gammaproteobacteria bacterium]